MATDSYLQVQEEAQTIIRLFTTIDCLLEKGQAYADNGLTRAAVSNQFARFSGWALDANALLSHKHRGSLSARLQEIPPKKVDFVPRYLCGLKENLDDIRSFLSDERQNRMHYPVEESGLSQQAIDSLVAEGCIDPADLEPYSEVDELFKLCHLKVAQLVYLDRAIRATLECYGSRQVPEGHVRPSVDASHGARALDEPAERLADSRPRTARPTEAQTAATRLELDKQFTQGNKHDEAALNRVRTHGTRAIFAMLKTLRSRIGTVQKRLSRLKKELPVEVWAKIKPEDHFTELLLYLEEDLENLQQTTSSRLPTPEKLSLCTIGGVKRWTERLGRELGGVCDIAQRVLSEALDDKDSWTKQVCQSKWRCIEDYDSGRLGFEEEHAGSTEEIRITLVEAFKAYVECNPGIEHGGFEEPFQ